MKSSKLLIIGSSGKIGNQILKHIDLDNTTYTYCNTPINNGVKFDITKNSISEIFDLGIYKSVLFLSALTNTNYCYTNRELSDLVNVVSTKRLLSELIENNVHFTFFSTEYVYDGKHGNYNETSQKNPIVIYGKQKDNIEKFIVNNTKNYTILRISKTYSNDISDQTIFSNWYKSLIIENNNEIACAMDQFFSPMLADDLFRIIKYLLENETIGIYNVGGPERLSRLTCLKNFIDIFKIKGVKILERPLNQLAKNETLPLDVSFETTKISNTINFKLTNVEKFLQSMKDKYAK